MTDMIDEPLEGESDAVPSDDEVVVEPEDPTVEEPEPIEPDGL